LLRADAWGAVKGRGSITNGAKLCKSPERNERAPAKEILSDNIIGKALLLFAHANCFAKHHKAKYGRRKFLLSFKIHEAEVPRITLHDK
jgi:hypothetical protein